MGRKPVLKAAHLKKAARPSAVAKAAGVSKSAISQSPKLKRREDGSIDFEKSIEILESIESEELKYQRARRELKEMERDTKKGLLIPIDSATTVWTTVAQSVRDGFLSLPDRLAPELAAVTDARQIRDQLRDEVRKILSNLPAQIHEAVKGAQQK
jgi:phage terminase Nu1 subunit (DNA packaging protein)